MSRRNFLRKLGLGVATIPLAKITTANDRATKNQKPLLKLGVLLPESTRYPVMGDNFLDALRMQLAANLDFQRHEIELYVEKYRTNVADLEQKTAKLAEINQVDMMTGLVSCHDTIKIKELLESKEILFIENTMGEVVQSANTESDCIFRNSFHLWNAAFVAGEWAAKNYGKRGILCSSFYDSGFNGLVAFEKGFGAAGGTILDRHVTDIPTQNGHVELFKAIKTHKPDFVFGHYCGTEAVSFVHSYKNSGLQAPLLGSGLMYSDANLNAQSSSANGMQSFSTWTRTHKHQANQDFVKAFEGTHQRYADPYAVLGFETGQLLRTALSKLGNHPSTQDLIAALSTITVDSPRGELVIKNQQTSCPVYLKKVTKNGDYFLENITHQYVLTDTQAPAIDELRTSIQSGWSNAYLT